MIISTISPCFIFPCTSPTLIHQWSTIITRTNITHFRTWPNPSSTRPLPHFAAWISDSNHLRSQPSQLVKMNQLQMQVSIRVCWIGGSGGGRRGGQRVFEVLVSHHQSGHCRGPNPGSIRVTVWLIEMVGLRKVVVVVVEFGIDGFSPWTWEWLCQPWWWNIRCMRFCLGGGW